jgi:tripartite-type tricarboxylate transporter receptor subunit TctC
MRLLYKRRNVIAMLGGAAASPIAARVGWGQGYPSRPVRIIVGFPPGGAADITARLISVWLSNHLGQSFVVENRPGAGTNIAAEAVAKSPADGYTLLLVSMANAANATLYERPDFDFIRDIAPVAGLIRGPLVMVLNPSVSASTIPEFIAYAAENPNKINVASAGNGTPSHLAVELFRMFTALDLFVVQYRGGAPALTDLIAGHMQVMFDNVPTSLEYIKSSRIRPLAVTSTARSESLLDVPTLSEFVPGYEVSSWFGIGVPRGTSAEVVGKLNTAINSALADPNIQARVVALGSSVIAGSPPAFENVIVEETAKWGSVIRAANIKVE